MMYVCSNCRTGDFFEEAELETSRDVEPHGEVTHWKECPKCGLRTPLIALDREGFADLRAFARSTKCSRELSRWAVDVLYDIASEQVTV